MASYKITITLFAVFLLVAVAAAPAEKIENKQDLVASEKDDLKPAASHWGGHYGYGGYYPQIGYGGFGYGGYGYGGYGGYGWPSYGVYGGYGYGWPYYGSYWW